MHQKGEYPFTVSPQGIKILPLSGMELIMKSSKQRNTLQGSWIPMHEAGCPLGDTRLVGCKE